MFTRKTTEEKAQIKDEENRKRLKLQMQKRQRLFDASPQGRARVAYSKNSLIFQIDLPFSQTTAIVAAMEKARTDEKTFDNSITLEKIESEGWEIDHVGYVYKVLGSVSRDKFMSSGQQEAMNGEIIGIYIFRRNESNKKEVNEN